MYRCLQLFVAVVIAGLAASAASAQSLTGTLKSIKDRKAILIGYQRDAYPMSFDGANGQPEGYSIELCRRIADEAGKAVGIDKLEIKFVPLTLENRFDAVASGKVDIECATSTVTLGRAQKVDFTNLTFVDGGGLLVKKGSGIRNVAGLVDETVAVIPGTTTEKSLKDALARSFINAKVVQVPDHSAGIAAVTSGKASAYASDQAILVGLLAKAGEAGANVELAPAQFSYEPYAFMIRRNDSDFRLVANRALARAYRSKDIVNIFEKWFATLGKPGEVLVVMYALNATPE